LLGEFYSLMGKIKSEKESQMIFGDLLTVHEIGNLMRRVDVAIMLMAGCTYEDVMWLLDVGYNKIRNVQKQLKNDKKGNGYKLLVERVISARKKRNVRIRKKELKFARKSERPDLEKMKEKYQGASLVFNVIDELSDSLIVKKEEKRRENNKRQATLDDYKQFRRQD